MSLKRLYRPVGMVVALAATILSTYYIASFLHGQPIRAFSSPRAASGIALGVLFYALAIGISAAGWQRLLSGTGATRPWRQLAGMVAITQIAKYIPGNFAQHIGRAGLALKAGIPAASVAVTAGVEVLLMMLASVFVGATALLLSGASPSSLHIERSGMALAIVLGAGCSIAGLVALRRFGAGILSRIAPQLARALDPRHLPSASSMQLALALYCLVYLAFGTGIVLMARMLVVSDPPDAWLLIGSFALAWIIGFVTPGAPAGVGVREGVMLLILGTQLSMPDASLIVLALRIVTTLGDVVLFPAGWLLARHPSAHQGA